jgi:ribosomal protein L11
VAGAKKKMAEGAKAVGEYTSKVEEGAAAFGKFSNTLLSVEGPLGEIGSLLRMGTGGLAGMAEGLMESAASGDLYLNMGLKLVDLSMDMIKYQLDFAIGQHDAIAEFRKATGAGTEYNDMMRKVERSNYRIGVSMEDVAGSTTAMKNTFTDFTYLSKDVQADLIETSTHLEKMGLSFGSQAQVMQVATQSMNMSVAESKQLMIDLASTARSLGMDIEEVGSQFLENKEFLVGFGDDAGKVFEDMAKQAKALGMEVSTLTGLMDKFSSFDEAGQAVGRLNSILGGPFLNSIDMMNAAFEDPIEGIKMLKEGFDQAGVAADSLSRPELLAFADALGLSAEETANLLGKSNEELEIQRIRQEELAEQARQTQSLTDQLSSAFNTMYVQLGPLIEDRIVPLISWLGGVTAAIGEVLLSKAGMITFFTVVGALFGTGIGLAIGMAFAMQAATAAIPFVGPALAAAQGVMVKAFIKKAAVSAGIGLLAGAAVGAGVGAVAGSGMKKKEEEESEEPRFQHGGTVKASTVAMVGEAGPEMVELPGGSRVTSAPATQQLTHAINTLSRKLESGGGAGSTGPIHLSVYIGQDKVDEIVVKALNSDTARNQMSPYANV